MVPVVVAVLSPRGIQSLLVAAITAADRGDWGHAHRHCPLTTVPVGIRIGVEIYRDRSGVVLILRSDQIRSRPEEEDGIRLKNGHAREEMIELHPDQIGWILCLPWLSTVLPPADGTEMGSSPICAAIAG